MARQSNFHGACSDSLREIFRSAWGSRGNLAGLPDLSDKLMQTIVARVNGDLHNPDGTIAAGYDLSVAHLVMTSRNVYYGCGGDPKVKIDWRQIYKDDLDGTDSKYALVI